MFFNLTLALNVYGVPSLKKCPITQTKEYTASKHFMMNATLFNHNCLQFTVYNVKTGNHQIENISTSTAF
jgi:hypothetical protein